MGTLFLGNHLAYRKFIEILGSEVVAVTLAVMLIVGFLGIYISWSTFQEKSKNIWLRDFAIIFAAIGGTSFRGADLTEADFSYATLKSTDFRQANL